MTVGEGKKDLRFKDIKEEKIIDDTFKNLTILKAKRKYQCKQCEKGFTNCGALWRHKRSIHEGAVYNCDKCEYTTKWSGNLKAHDQRKHENLNISSSPPGHLSVVENFDLD